MNHSHFSRRDALRATGALVGAATVPLAFGQKNFPDKPVMGLARPSPSNRRPLIRDGYLISAPTLADLASLIDLPVQTLQTTVERFNANAVEGKDPDFNRGASSYNLSMGDPTHMPKGFAAGIQYLF